MPQTSVSADPAIGLAGQSAYPGRPETVDSKLADDSAGIPFGVFVTRKADNTVDLPTSAGEVTTTGVGFAKRDPTKEYGATGYAAGEMVPVMRKGYILVATEDAVTQEGAVYARHTASGGNTQLGKCRSDGDTNTAAAVPNARYATSTTGAGLAVVEVW